MEFLIQPRFNQFQGSFFFETDSLNGLLEAEYNDHMGFYQSTFGVYSYMTLNSELDFVIHYPEGAPLLWQPHNNCAWTPTSTIQFNQRTISPCRAKVNEQRCYDEYFGTTYKYFNAWNTGAVIGKNQVGIDATDMLTRTIVKNASMGARMTLVGGGLHSTASSTFVEGVGVRIQDAFIKTSTTCTGWIQLCKTLSATSGLEHLNNTLIRAADISADGKTWVGDGGRDIVALYDEYLAASGTPQQLIDAIITGGVSGMGETFYPMFLVAPPEYRAVDAAWKAQRSTAAVNDPRIRREQFTITTPSGAQRTVYVFFIDDTVVIPVDEPAKYSTYLTGTDHFAYLTISGTIQLGANFANLPVVNESEVAVMMQMSTDAEDYGTHKFLAHSLFAVAINDTNYITGDYVYAEPA